MFISRIINRCVKEISKLFYKGKYLKIGKGSFIISPLQIDGANNIIIGDNVLVQYKSWLASQPLTGYDSILSIGDNCRIGNFNHIYATKSIIIEENVLTADKVYISDNLHGYEDINLPVLKQPIVQNNEVVIGAGTWLGENVCVLGAKIGKNCVIGANAVVVKNIPDYCVAVGIPAKIIKRYCFELNSWEKTDSSGDFINSNLNF